MTIENKGAPADWDALRRVLVDADRLLHAYSQGWPMPSPELSREDAKK